MGHLAGGQQGAPRIAIRAFWNNIPRRCNSLVNHLRELHVSAVLIEGHDEALVFNAGNGGVVSMLACKNLLSAILILAADVCVFGSVEPEQRHHHLAVIWILPQ